ncbi:hypothetical protein D046_8240B, partial [Vibrio parahaemolyticus V-223/04]
CLLAWSAKGLVLASSCRMPLCGSLHLSWCQRCARNHQGSLGRLRTSGYHLACEASFLRKAQRQQQILRQPHSNLDDQPRTCPR